jgi:hypothetical protein
MKIRSTKSEIRNKFECRTLATHKTKLPVRTAVWRIAYSDFEIRISSFPRQMAFRLARAASGIKAQATEWIEQQQRRLLPGVPYFLVTFTVPEQLRPLLRSQQKEGYALLFAESAATLQDVAANPNHLGAPLGMLGVLHTWGRPLQYHPPIHYVVAGGGLTEDGLQWKRVANAEYLLPEPVLAARFRSRMKAALQERPAWWAAVPASAWRQGWVVDCVAVGSGESALKYLAAYVVHTALSSQRIVRDAGGRIPFSYRESESGATKAMTVEADEFLRRFLQHVLPKGFQRVRYFGWLAPAARGAAGADRSVAGLETTRAARARAGAGAGVSAMSAPDGVGGPTAARAAVRARDVRSESREPAARGASDGSGRGV